ncbi:MAG: response regulator [Candidatus Kariarchaeaceae archaeon]|jgi:DNA-binding NtrC family response regulator
MDKISVLIADDDVGYRFPLASILEDFNYQVFEARNVEEVRKYSDKADIWVVDVRLPSEMLEGIVIVKELLADKNCRLKNKVIFISVLCEEDYKSKLDNFPNIGYIWIEKPFEPEYLLQTIDDIIEKQK